jgi:hypothetical protein
VSNQIGRVSGESASRAVKGKKPKELANRNIVPLDPAPRATPPSELAQLFADPPLVGNEKREDFDRFFSAIASAVRVRLKNHGWVFRRSRFPPMATRIMASETSIRVS